MKVEFNVREALETLKKDAKTNCEKTIVSMIQSAFADNDWIPAEMWNPIKYENKNILCAFRNGTTSVEMCYHLTVDGKGRLFRKWEKDRILFFRPMPEAPEMPEAESEEEDVFVPLSEEE